MAQFVYALPEPASISKRGKEDERWTKEMEEDRIDNLERVVLKLDAENKELKARINNLENDRSA